MCSKTFVFKHSFLMIYFPSSSSSLLHSSFWIKVFFFHCLVVVVVVVYWSILTSRFLFVCLFGRLVGRSVDKFSKQDNGGWVVNIPQQQQKTNHPINPPTVALLFALFYHSYLFFHINIDNDDGSCMEVVASHHAWLSNKHLSNTHVQFFLSVEKRIK